MVWKSTLIVHSVVRVHYIANCERLSIVYITSPEPVCAPMLLSKSVVVPVACNEGYACWNTVILRNTGIR